VRPLSSWRTFFLSAVRSMLRFLMDMCVLLAPVFAPMPPELIHHTYMKRIGGRPTEACTPLSSAERREWERLVRQLTAVD
jgi:hypothetical protein